MKNILIFDCETTGLPVSYTASFKDKDNWPRIIQLAWELCDETGRTIEKSCNLVKPDGWQMPTGDFWIEHGYTQEQNEAEGIPMLDLLKDFCRVLNECNRVVSHNLGYDKPIIECEMYRSNIRPINYRHIEKYCTKLASAPILKMPGYHGDYKWPSLAEAYQFMFSKGFDGAHDAGFDVQACKEVYLWIQDYNAIQELL